MHDKRIETNETANHGKRVVASNAKLQQIIQAELEGVQRGNDRLLTYPEVKQRVPVSAHALRRYELAGLLPTFRPGGRQRLWRLSDVQAFIRGETLPTDFRYYAGDVTAANAALEAKRAAERQAKNRIGRKRQQATTAAVAGGAS